MIIDHPSSVISCYISKGTYAGYVITISVLGIHTAKDLTEAAHIAVRKARKSVSYILSSLVDRGRLYIRDIIYHLICLP